MTLSIGSPAPAVCGLTQDETEFDLSSLRGEWVVLYFYPRDNTPGCTREAQDFNRHLQEFAALGARVVGVSADTPKSHRRFAEKYQLAFPLLSDQEKQIISSFGVLNEKGSGARRSTFILDPEGKIRYIFPRVTVEGHAEEVLAKLRELQQMEQSGPERA
ncbi:MAG: peroxiredoxin [Limnochordales bacterium]|nr:peroxiredoxin [Limnochordales bacterium]